MKNYLHVNWLTQIHGAQLNTSINEGFVNHTRFHDNVCLSSGGNNLFFLLLHFFFNFRKFRHLFPDVHHTPNNENENYGMHEKTHSRWTTIRGSNTRTKNSPDETESLGVGNHEESETRNYRSDKLLLLLLTITTTSTIFKDTHDYIYYTFTKKLT
jgi:hypothetical protein